jgi:redox-sensitive bicupin YhaK (pirin superfamily)
LTLFYFLIIQNIATEQIPEISWEDGVKIRLIVGKLDGIHGPETDIFADPTYMDVSILANGSFSYPIERGRAAFAHVFEGEGVFGANGGQKGETVTHPRLAVLSNTGFLKPGQPHLMFGFC